MKTGSLAALARVRHLWPRVLLVSLILTRLLPAALGQKACNVDLVNLAEGEQCKFSMKAAGQEAHWYRIGKRGRSFDGFAVTILGEDGTEHTAWFPPEEDCFPGNDVLHEVDVSVRIKPEKSGIEFGFQSGKCKRTCESDGAPQALTQLNVELHGPSLWTTNLQNNNPNHLEKRTNAPQSHKLPTCNKPTTAMSTGAAIGIALAVLVGVALVVVVVVAVRFRKKIKKHFWTGE